MQGHKTRNRKMRSRREIFELAGGLVLGSCLPVAEASTVDEVPAWLQARPPLDFLPASYPGLVSKAEARSSYADIMQPNQLWPRAEVAQRLLERALCDLTGDSDLPRALRRFIHPKDSVAIKVNGISGQDGATVAVNFELIRALVQGLVALGTPPAQIQIYEQFPAYLKGTRVGTPGHELPDGVRTSAHNNFITNMPEVQVFERTRTRYCKQLTDASALINMTMFKDHSLCGFTGALKNLTHGNILNPAAHHAHQCSPQIALLYHYPVVRSRARLHIADVFKLICDLGPLDKSPAARVPHGAVYVSTDPVALDAVGADVVRKIRSERKLPTWEAQGRSPRYLETSADLGLGECSLDRIRLKSALV